jgi:acetyltransferase-like isoleucine patch superfamily enzyme
MNALNYLKGKLVRVLNSNSYKLFPIGKSIIISRDLIMGSYTNITIDNPNVAIKIDSGVIFKEFCSVLIFPGASLSVGKNVFFNNYCSINCLQEIKVGDNTLFGEGVKLYDHNHEYERNTNLKIHPDKFTLGAISIGENCWIGSNVTILKAVTIGSNVIIGANCLIYKSIPSNSIVKAGTSLTIQTL